MGWDSECGWRGLREGFKYILLSEVGDVALLEGEKWTRRDYESGDEV